MLHLDFQDESTLFNNPDNVNNDYVITNKAVDQISDKKLENRYKLIYGLLFSMRSFVKKVSTNKETDTFRNFSTSEYKLHYIELINGLRFIILTNPTKSDYANNLKEIFKNYYFPLISSNMFADKDAFITNEIFIESVKNYLKTII